MPAIAEGRGRWLSESGKGLLAGLLVVVCWSGFNIVSRFGSKGIFTPFDLAAMRVGVSGLIGLPIFVRYVPGAEWPRYVVLSLFGGLGGCSSIPDFPLRRAPMPVSSSMAASLSARLPSWR